MKVETNWKYRGFQVVSLENRYLRVDILPELGANIYNLIYKPTSRNMLWHNPRTPPRPVFIGSSYDNNFRGGWDELFPNDMPEEFEGELYPDHGEIWCQRWEHLIVEENEKLCTLYLRTQGSVTSTMMEKWITLHEGETHLRFRHKLTNLGHKPLRFLWKLHPALDASEHHRIDLPAKVVEVGPCLGNCRGVTGEKYQWPYIGSGEKTHDMRQVLPVKSQTAEMHYAVELEKGWCALTDQDSRLGIGFCFDKEIFKTVWLFMTYGGWRGLHTVILEPCTTYPDTLREASKRGQLAVLEGQSSLETSTLAVIYAGLNSVSEIDGEGQVRSA